MYCRSLFNNSSTKSDSSEESDTSDECDISEEPDNSDESVNSDESYNSDDSVSESTDFLSVSCDSDEQNSAENSAIERNVNEELDRLFFL